MTTSHSVWLVDNLEGRALGEMCCKEGRSKAHSMASRRLKMVDCDAEALHSFPLKVLILEELLRGESQKRTGCCVIRLVENRVTFHFDSSCNEILAKDST